MGVASQLHVNGHAIRAGIAQVSRQRACSNSLAAAQVKDKRNTVRHVQIQRHLRQCRQVGRRAGSHGSLPSVTGVRIRARASRACIQTLNLPRRAAKASRERLVGRGSSVIAVRIVWHVARLAVAVTARGGFDARWLRRRRCISGRQHRTLAAVAGRCG
jgi:hypothetical protein